jgi:hypothetical protein
MIGLNGQVTMLLFDGGEGSRTSQAAMLLYGVSQCSRTVFTSLRFHAVTTPVTDLP